MSTVKLWKLLFMLIASALQYTLADGRFAPNAGSAVPRPA
jgi:hypothetical protein